MEHRPLQPGDPAPAFSLPTVNRDGPVSLDDYRGKRAVLVALFRGLHCPFCRRQIARLSATRQALAEEGVETVAVVNTPLERARLYYQYRPTPLVLAADPDVRTHQAFGLGETSVLPDDTDPSQLKWPYTTSIAHFTQMTTRSRPELPEAVSAFDAMHALNRQDGFEPNEVDQQIAQVHGLQASGHFLIGADGVIRWTFIEAAESAADVCRFPSDGEIVAAVRAAPRH
jgi:peroxiredoxin